MTAVKPALADGSLLRAEGSPAVWLVLGGTRWGIPSGKLLNKLAPRGKIVDVPAEQLARIPDTPPDGTVVAGSETGRYYLIICGIRFWLSPEHVRELGLSIHPTVELHDELMDAVPYGGIYRTWIPQGRRLRDLTANALLFFHNHAADTRGILVGIFASAIFYLITKLVG